MLELLENLFFKFNPFFLKLTLKGGCSRDLTFWKPIFLGVLSVLPYMSTEKKRNMKENLAATRARGMADVA